MHDAVLPAGTAWEVESRSLLPPVRQALAAASGRSALLLPPLPPRPRRAARLLLQDAARAGDGLSLDAATGEILLLGCDPAVATRAEAALAALGLAGWRSWMITEAEDATELLAWAATAEPPPRPAAPSASLAVPGLDQVVLRRVVLQLGPGVAPRRLARRLVVSRRRLAHLLPPAHAKDPELLEETAAEAERRLAASLGGEVEAAASPGGPEVGAAPVMLRPAAQDAPPPLPGAIALLPLAAAADPAGLARHAAALCTSGWGAVGLDGLEAAHLPLLDAAALPGTGPLLLRWSPALAGRAGLAALRGRLDPARLVLTACDTTEALGWGLEVGIRAFAGPALEALVQAARMQAA